jgi:hypothetical protein
MTVVALVGLLIWSGQAVARWHRYRKLAEYHAAEFTNLSMMLAPALEIRNDTGRFPGCGLSQVFLESECEKVEWHGRLKSKYERAAARPWLPVEPDPPEPK